MRRSFFGTLLMILLIVAMLSFSLSVVGNYVLPNVRKDAKTDSGTLEEDGRVPSIDMSGSGVLGENSEKYKDVFGHPNDDIVDYQDVFGDPETEEVTE